MKRLLARLLAYFPTKLPVGLTAFHAWADSIIDITGEFADRDSMKWAIASNLIHLPTTTDRKSKEYFARTLRKAAANQVASQVFQDIKQKQADKAAADKAAEVTAPQSVTHGQIPIPKG
jgi:hypothetical protein